MRMRETLLLVLMLAVFVVPEGRGSEALPEPESSEGETGDLWKKKKGLEFVLEWLDDSGMVDSSASVQAKADLAEVNQKLTELKREPKEVDSKTPLANELQLNSKMAEDNEPVGVEDSSSDDAEGADLGMSTAASDEASVAELSREKKLDGFVARLLERRRRAKEKFSLDDARRSERRMRQIREMISHKQQEEAVPDDALVEPELPSAVGVDGGAPEPLLEPDVRQKRKRRK
jgi:hypothetical protein